MRELLLVVIIGPHNTNNECQNMCKHAKEQYLLTNVIKQSFEIAK